MLLSFYRTIISQTISSAMSGTSYVVNIAAFFIIAISLFIFVIPNQEALLQIAPGVIWIFALLSSFLAVDVLYKNDFEDGFLEQFLIRGVMAEHLVMAKIIAHFIITGLPIICIMPLVKIMFGINLNMIPSLMLGTFALSLITSIGSALTLELSSSRSVIELLILPLYVPILIFGISQSYILLFATILFILPISIFTSKFAIIMAIKS